ncbi:hypothetical protein EDD41_1543 [Luteococcus japonicus]|uniref:Uncharacterized protein n=2 Tax=Luteococcus japonicus TaxID=33984 RepID=A0A3N1ZU06_9ACTN|nr:hypothetical protein EDD41_1543 [Luteococcus japonicus]
MVPELVEGRPARKTRSMRTKTCPTSAALTSLGLVGGYGLASTTRNRPLGGAVLAAAGIAAGLKWKEQGALTTIGLAALYLGAFGGSHPLAKKMGAWPSVLTVTAITAAASWALVDRVAD